MRLAGHVARMGEERKVYEVLVGNLEGKRALGRLRRRWEDNFKVDLTETGFGGVEWIHLAKDRAQWRAHLNTAVNLLVSQKAGNFLTAERMLISQGLSFTELLL